MGRFQRGHCFGFRPSLADYSASCSATRSVSPSISVVVVVVVVVVVSVHSSTTSSSSSSASFLTCLPSISNSSLTSCLPSPWSWHTCTKSTLLPISLEKQLRWNFSPCSFTAMFSKEEVKLGALLRLVKGGLFDDNDSPSS